MAGEPLADDEILGQIAQAREPHAAAVSYDRTTRRLHIGLTNGAELNVAVALVPELRGANDADLGAVEVGPAGVGMHWPALDVDLSVTGLTRVGTGDGRRTRRTIPPSQRQRRPPNPPRETSHEEGVSVGAPNRGTHLPGGAVRG